VHGLPRQKQEHREQGTELVSHLENPVFQNGRVYEEYLKKVKTAEAAYFEALGRAEEALRPHLDRLEVIKQQIEDRMGVTNLRKEYYESLTAPGPKTE
jgi:hypothetical protein